MDYHDDVTLKERPTAADSKKSNVRALNNTKRIQLDLSPKVVQILNDLKERTEAVSYAEVFKNAIKLYAGLIEEVEGGSKFLVEDKNGNVSSFRMFL